MDAWRVESIFVSTALKVDPTRLGVTWSSQGWCLHHHHGGYAPRNTAPPAAGAPYFRGFMDAIALTHTYPYEEINDFYARILIVAAPSSETCRLF